MRRLRPLDALPVAVALLILVASVVDPPSGGASGLGPLGVVGVDKYYHAAAYAALASTVAWARGRSTLRALVLAVLVATGYGFGIELVQSTLPARSFDLVDALANAVGATLGATAWRVARSPVAAIRQRLVE